MGRQTQCYNGGNMLQKKKCRVNKGVKETSRTSPGRCPYRRDTAARSQQLRRWWSVEWNGPRTPRWSADWWWSDTAHRCSEPLTGRWLQRQSLQPACLDWHETRKTITSEASSPAEASYMWTEQHDRFERVLLVTWNQSDCVVGRTLNDECRKRMKMWKNSEVLR